MLASAQPGLPGISGGLAGFSKKSMIRPAASTCITPSPLACWIGVSTHATVTSAPEFTCCTSMCS